MNLLVTGAWTDAKAHLKHIEELGHSVVFMQMEKDDFPCEPEWVEGVICNGLFLYHPISDFPNLRFIQLTSAGFDRVDMEYVRDHDIEIHNARGVYSIPMAEYAVCGVLELYKQTRFFHANQLAHNWEKHRGLKELFGKTITVVGCGSVGTECAKRFRAFDCRVIGIDIATRYDDAYEKILPFEMLDSALTATDILVLTVPLTEGTLRLLDRKRLQLLPESAVVVNISRGKVVDEAAIIELLQENRLAGAVLDVFEEEPLPPDSPIWNTKNLIATPHNSFVGEGNAERLNETILHGILRIRS